MHDSYLMGLQLFLLMLLSQTAWERLVRRDPKAGSPCTGSSATAAAGLEGGRSGGESSGLRGHVRPCLPLPALVQAPSPPRGGRKARVHWDNFSGNPLPLGKSPRLPGPLLGTGRTEASCVQCCEIGSGFFLRHRSHFTCPFPTHQQLKEPAVSYVEPLLEVSGVSAAFSHRSECADD